MDVDTVGDIEAQQHNPNWFVQRNYMLRPKQEGEQEGEENKLGFFILKVPEFMRQPLISFSPQGWQFGLHNRENLDNSGSEAVKLGIAMQFGLVGTKWNHFCDTIVDDPKAMLACYGLQNEVTSWTDEQIKCVLALDALFLATYIDVQFPENERQLWTSNVPSLFNENNVFFTRYDMWLYSIQVDLFRVENQIPFVLIDKVVDYISNSIASATSKGNQPLIGGRQYQQRSVEIAGNELLKCCFMITSGEGFKIDNSCLLDEKTHILGVAYKTICGSEGLLMKEIAQRNTPIHIPSATKLEQSGIKIVGVDGPLFKMSYKKNAYVYPR